MSQPALEPGRVAVVTGAASGIGLAVCKRLAERGMRVCLADVDEAKLEAAREAVAALAANGADDVLAVPVDVSRRADLERLHAEVVRKFGEVALLMNNAAAFRFGGAFRDQEAWETTFAVNVMGVVHGLQVFVPEDDRAGDAVHRDQHRLEAGDHESARHPQLQRSQGAVKSLTESLQHELRSLEGCRVTAHLLVPGWTTTGEREHQPGAWLPEQVADHLLAALERGDFYILCPDGEVTPEMDRKRVIWGAMDVAENRPPLSRWHPDYAGAFESFDP